MKSFFMLRKCRDILIIFFVKEIEIAKGKIYILAVNSSSSKDVTFDLLVALFYFLTWIDGMRIVQKFMCVSTA